MRLTVVLLFTFSFFLFPFSLVSASESALSASPAILETVLESANPTVKTITIQNNTNFPLPIKGSSSAFLATETIPDAAKNTYNASRWLALEPADFILQPQEIKKITVTITPPPGAEPGGHYATLYFRPLIPEDAVSHGSTFSLARIGVLVMMIMPGELTESIQPGPLFAPSFAAFGPIKYLSTLTNSGTVHLLPKSTLTIKNLWGKVVATLETPPTLVLPHTTKEHHFLWEQRLGFGPYTATYTTHYGTNQTPLQSNPATTWIIPWPLILTAILLLTFIYKIFIVNRKRISLAVRVLKGQYEPPETTQENPRYHPRPHPRPHPAGSRPKRRPRRQSNRGQSQPL